MTIFRNTLLAAIYVFLACGCTPTTVQREPAQTRHLSDVDGTIRLGEEQRVRQLYSYPNNCNVVVCYQDETLEQTVKRWFDASLKRDGFTGDSVVRQDNGKYYIDITLSPDSSAKDLKGFVNRYEQFLNHGDKGVELARAFHKAGRWLPNWRFILPHGLAMTNNRSLEVMNFPPVSLILKTQDYLDSATTHRWMKMLEENGVKPKNKDLYGAILDIVPVAAPANEGRKLREDHIYDGSFNGYAMPMLSMWTEVKGTNHSKPVMTLGGEMKIWFNDNYKTGFENILDVALVKVTTTRSAPIMFTNHPSKIFYHKNQYEVAKAIMDQDVIASCWQAQMGMRPGTDPFKMKKECTTRWADKKQRKCELLEMQLYDKSQAEATKICKKKLGGSSKK